MRIDLNADLGEGMGDDAALMQVISSANVACGGHAGDAASMRQACRLALAAGVRIGAHPSYPDRAGFGRTRMDLQLPELRRSVAEQVDALIAAAAAVGATVAHLKPHGALYNVAAVDADVAALVAEIAAERDLPLMGLAGGRTVAAASAAGTAHLAEAFLDRGYRADGTLVPRAEPGALLDAGHAERAVRMVVDGVVVAVDGTVVRLRPDTLCVHGDTPGAAALAAEVREALEAAGVRIAGVRIASGRITGADA